LEIDGTSDGDSFGANLGRRASELGVAGPAALIWGDATPPPGARAVSVRVGESSIEGWLVGSAQHIDMGQLASEMHDVVLIGIEKRHLVASHPSGPGRFRFDLDREGDESQRRAVDTFALVSVEPGDVADDSTAQEVVALLTRLPQRVRYVVMPLPG